LSREAERESEEKKKEGERGSRAPEEPFEHDSP
jgi:hypothetical protein